MVSRKYKKSRKSRKSRKTIKHLNQVGGGNNSSQPPPPGPGPPTPLVVHDPADLEHVLINAVLINAVSAGNLEETHEALERGANSNARAEGGTPLIIASKIGYEEIVIMLLENGADVNAKNNDGETAVWHSARNGDIGVMSALVNYSTQPDIDFIQGPVGSTPLDIATESKETMEDQRQTATNTEEDNLLLDERIQEYNNIIASIKASIEFEFDLKHGLECIICTGRAHDTHVFITPCCGQKLCANCLKKICEPKAIQVHNEWGIVDEINIKSGVCPFCNAEIRDDWCDNIEDILATNPQIELPDVVPPSFDGAGKGTKTRSHRNKKRKSRHSKKRGRKTRSTR